MYEKDWEIFSLPAGPVNVSSLLRVPKNTDVVKFIVLSALYLMLKLSLFWASPMPSSERSNV